MSKYNEDAVYDPVVFAEHVYGSDLGFELASEAQAELCRLCHELEAVPELNANPEIRDIYVKLTEAAWSYATESGSAGVRAGVAIEQFRVRMKPAQRICPDCHSLYGRQGKPGRETCTTCKGAGAVPASGVVAR